MVQVAVAGLEVCKAFLKLVHYFDVQTKQFTDWQNQLMDRTAQVFRNSSDGAPAVDLKALHARIRELTLADFLRNRTHPSGTAERKTAIDCARHLPVTRQRQPRRLVLARHSAAHQTPINSDAS